MANGVISQITLPSGNTYEIKDRVARQSIAGNGTFVIAWAGNSDPSTAEAQALIPAGVKVKYGTNGTVRTGTLPASADTLKKFYLVKSSTLPDSETLDIYDEYVTIQDGTEQSPTYSWEKIGDTQIKLTQIVTNVVLDKTNKTASVIGNSATLKVNTAPTYTVTPGTTYVSASASGGSVSYTPTDDNKDMFLKNVTANTKKLETTTVTGVSGSTTASKVSEGTSQTTAKGTGTSSTSTEAWLKGWSISGETLTLKGVTMDTQTTTQITIDNASVTVPQAANSATRVATGELVATDSYGDDVATGITISNTDKAKALVSLPRPSITQPTISLSTGNDSGTGKAAVASTSTVNATNTGVGTIGFNSKDTKTVLTSDVDVSVTHAP